VTETDRAALSGLKVLEIAQLIAGPMSGSFLADLGADVIHIEDPRAGDPQRLVGIDKDGIGLWWKVSARNKRCITLDLRQPEGQELARRLAEWADVVITNFRVGTLESWGLDWESLHRVNPTLVMLQISGYGANTTLRNEPGFGKVGEAMSGVVQITGWPDGPPVHTGFSHADSVTGLMGAFAVTAAMHRKAVDPDFDGEWIDIALFESLYRLIEWQVIVHDQTGLVPERVGNRLAVAPAAVVNTYLTVDDQWITVTTGTPRSVQKVVACLGEPAEDYDTVEKQRAASERINELLTVWIGARTAGQVLGEMRAMGVTASKIYTVEDILADQTYAEREAVIEVDDQDFGPVRMQAVVPKMANHPGAVWRTGPSLGQDDLDVYHGVLGLSADELSRLQAKGVVAGPDDGNDVAAELAAVEKSSLVVPPAASV
jgi:formyl-CoA transferase